MPAKLNPIRKALVKKSLLAGSSIRQALADGGYAPGTQRGNNNGTDNRLVKTCQEEIATELKLADLTPDHFVRKSETLFSKALSLKKPDLTNANRTMEFQGRIAGVDKQNPTVVNLFETDSLSVSADALTALARRR